jgi:hypothetical protein
LFVLHEAISGRALDCEGRGPSRLFSGLGRSEAIAERWITTPREAPNSANDVCRFG